MVVLAVMAAGAHTMSIAAPALAEQERMAREAEAAAERSVAPNPGATEGLPVPALLGGIVLAFAVGLAGGQVQRRRRSTRRTATARMRPAPEPTPVVAAAARTAPPPPEPVAPPEPKPIEIAAPPPPPPPPPPVRSRGQRILRFRPAPAPPPPEPDEPVADEIEARATADEILAEPRDEIVADEIAAPAPADEIAEPAPTDDYVEPAPADDYVAPPEPAAEPAGPLSVAPEVPQRDEAQAPAEVDTPLAKAPEAMRPLPDGEPEIVALPARRFARSWPADAETLWTCEIAWKAGYVKSTFRAMAGPPGGAARRKSIGDSPSLRWTLMTDPEPPTPEMIASVKVLVSALVEAGWERIGRGSAWYAQRFVWRADGEPEMVSVPDAIESAEPPTR